MAQHSRTSATQQRRGAGPIGPLRFLIGAFIALALGLLVVKVVVPAVLGRDTNVTQGEQSGQPVPAAPETTEQVQPPAEEAPAPQPAPDLSTFAGMLAAGQVSSIRVIGDSITAGYLIDGYEGYNGTDVMIYSGGEGTYYEPPADIHSWTNAFRAYSAEHGVASFVNASVSGFRMQYLAEDPDAWLGDGATVIVVMLGTNDAAKESIEDFNWYASEALSAAAGRCTHLVVVSPPNNERTDTQNLYSMDQIDAALTEVCAVHGWEHISLLDVLAVGTEDFFEDQVHPTDIGSAKLWEAFHARLGLA